MKKNYGIKMDRSVIYFIVFLAAIVSGSLYALYIQDDNYKILLAINSCMMTTQYNLKPAEIFQNAWIVYAKQLGIIWIATLSSFTIPLAWFVFFVMMFSYSFTVSCFIMIYGLKGLWTSFCLFGIQGASIILLVIYITANCNNRILSIKKNEIQKCIYHFIVMVAAICGLSLIDSYVYLIIHKIF